MNILFLCDDSDDAMIFEDTITEIDPEINCITIPGDKNAFSALRSGTQPDAIFLDLNNLTEKSVQNFLHIIRSNRQWKS